MLVYSTISKKRRRRKMKPNSDIRNMIRVSGFCSWQVANKLGIHENSLYRMLRKDLDEKERTRIMQSLVQLKSEREAELSKLNNVPATY
jgi:hypothetical protein